MNIFRVLNNYKKYGLLEEPDCKNYGSSSQKPETPAPAKKTATKRAASTKTNNKQAAKKKK